MRVSRGCDGDEIAPDGIWFRVLRSLNSWRTIEIRSRRTLSVRAVREPGPRRT